MKTNITVLWVMTVYFFILAAVYSVWSVIDKGHIEWVGTLAIALSGGLTVFIAFFLQVVQRNAGGVLPEDRLDAEIQRFQGDRGLPCHMEFRL